MLADIITITAPSLAEAGQRVDIQVSIKNLHNDYMGIMVSGALDYGESPWPRINFPTDSATFEPWQYYYFEGYFSMPYLPPGAVIRIHVYSYWYGDAGEGYNSWHLDDEMVKDIIISGAAPEPRLWLLDSEILRLEPIAVGRLWQLDSKILFLGPLEPGQLWLLDSEVISLSPIIPGEPRLWLLDTRIISLSPKEELPIPECSIDSDCPLGYVCQDGICVPEVIPPIPCSVDADCPEGYICKDGKCVKKEEEVNWIPLAIAGAGVGTIMLAGKKPSKPKKGKKVAKK